MRAPTSGRADSEWAEDSQPGLAHRIDIRSYSPRDASEIKGVIHNRHEEIDRLNDGNLAREAYYGPVVTRLEADQDVGVPCSRKNGDDVAQVLRTQLAASTTAVAELCQTNVHPLPPLDGSTVSERKDSGCHFVGAPASVRGDARG